MKTKAYKRAAEVNNSLAERVEKSREVSAMRERVREVDLSKGPKKKAHARRFKLARSV